jgi:glycosyltransferase involved in cell wall biosynthesis
MEISVIITAYNKAEYIVDCLLGILNQKHNFEIEIILADDCSNDNTEQEIYKLNEHPNFPIIRYYKHEENKGLMKNFLWAITQAKGKYVSFCDGDDIWVNELKLKSQVEILEANQFLTGCGTLMDIIDTRNVNSKINYFDLHFNYEKDTIINENEITNFTIFPFGTSSFIYRKDSLNLSIISCFDFVKVSNDFVLFNLVFSKGQLLYLHDLSVKRNHNPNGETVDDNQRNLFLILNQFLMFKILISLADIRKNKLMYELLKEKSNKYEFLIVNKFSNRSLRIYFDNIIYYSEFKLKIRLFMILINIGNKIICRKFLNFSNKLIKCAE